MGLNEVLLKAVSSAGYVSPTHIQQITIPQLLQSGTDLIALAQTGTGKTAAFGLPLIQKIAESDFAYTAIVLCPTRELCLQTSNELQKFSAAYKPMKIATIYGGAGITEQKKALRKHPHLIVATPGRFIDFMKQGEIDLQNCRFVVLDEADEMLNMGFRDDVEEILSEVPKERNVWLFSATMPEQVRYLANKYLKNAEEVQSGRKNSTNPNIKHQYYVAPSGREYEVLRRLLDMYPFAYALIFVRTKENARLLAEKLIVDGFDADALHGDLSQQLREQVMGRFRNQSLKLLIATDVAARGIDVNDVTHVFHYNLPDDLEVYTHRSGRTARAGKDGISVAIISKRDMNRMRMLERSLKIQFEEMKIPVTADILSNHLQAILNEFHKNKEHHAAVEVPEYINEKLHLLTKDELISFINEKVFSKLILRYSQSDDQWTTKTQHDRTRGDRDDRRRTDRGDDRGNRRGDRGSDRKGRHDDGGDDYKEVKINVGNKHGFEKQDLFALMRNRELRRVNLGRIKIQATQSFIEVPSSDVRTFTDHITGRYYGDVEIVVSGNSRAEGGRSRERRSY